MSDGSTIYECSFGNVGPSDALPYASLTKVFTSTLAAQLAAADELTLTEHPWQREPIDSSVSPTDAARWRALTVDDLLRHRGGFDRDVSGDPMFLHRQPCGPGYADLAAISFDHNPGVRFAYSNVGYCLVGRVLSQRTGKTYQSLLTDNILIPANLHSVRFLRPQSAYVRDLRRKLRFESSDERRAFDRIPWNNLEAVGQLGGTARDFGALLSSLLGGGRAEMAQPGLLLLEPLVDCDETLWRHCHGRSFYSYRLPGRDRMYWRDGSLPGITAFATLVPPDKWFVLLGTARNSRWKSAHDELGKLAYHNMTGP